MSLYFKCPLKNVFIAMKALAQNSIRLSFLPCYCSGLSLPHLCTFLGLLNNATPF
jgi:hypothetical protein